MIKNGVRADWMRSFLTLPGHRHSHLTVIGADAPCFRFSRMRAGTESLTPEITFSHPGHDHTAYISRYARLRVRPAGQVVDKLAPSPPTTGSRLTVHRT